MKAKNLKSDNSHSWFSSCQCCSFDTWYLSGYIKNDFSFLDKFLDALYIQVLLITEVINVIVCIVLISLHWQPIWIILQVTWELPAAQRASWGVEGLLLTEGFMESFYLFSYSILNVTQNKRSILSAFLFPPPSSEYFEFIWIIIWILYFASKTMLKQCNFLQTRTVWCFINACTLISPGLKKAWICQSF